jgi:DNA polymerase-1
LVIYGGSANRISTALQVDKELAQQLLDNYFKLFPELKVYIDNISTLVKYQGWVECPVTNRRYWCKEDNAKGLGDDNSASRKGCNTLIQGISALMTKRAAYYVDQKFELLNSKYKCNSRIVGLVHD